MNQATGYRYAINQLPNFIPDQNSNFTTENSIQLKVDKDGVYYFHLLPSIPGKDSAVPSHFKIMIDSTAPKPAIIQASEYKVKRGELVRFDFRSSDELSGLQQGFYVKFKKHAQFLPVKPPLYVPFLDKGEYIITIRAFDKANNFSDSSIKIKVE